MKTALKCIQHQHRQQTLFRLVISHFFFVIPFGTWSRENYFTVQVFSIIRSILSIMQNIVKVACSKDYGAFYHFIYLTKICIFYGFGFGLATVSDGLTIWHSIKAHNGALV